MEKESFKLTGADLIKKARTKEINGKKYWHVTSVLGVTNEPEHTVPEEELDQYAARGTLAHLEAQLMLGEGINLNEKREAESVLQRGSLGLKAIDTQVIKNFIARYPEFGWGNARTETFLWSDELSLCGTCDLILTKGSARNLVIADWKTASSYSQQKKDLYFKQMAAYAIMLSPQEAREVTGLYIFPLNPKNKSGFGKPIFTEEVQKYKELFMLDYQKFITLTK